ncbi:CLUMA_CG021109, isoform A [Clunio marinus]|uniref:CLUMA_CG021109, isoform A n=1 Tax=Clunio marinus TaxID=568069 RepID=A0A1J1J8U9_9DIPT|nr:CLUMA_CG021109, isoform A [Clunio marinus]
MKLRLQERKASPLLQYGTLQLLFLNLSEGETNKQTNFNGSHENLQKRFVENEIKKNRETNITEASK